MADVHGRAARVRRPPLGHLQPGQGPWGAGAARRDGDADPLLALRGPAGGPGQQWSAGAGREGRDGVRDAGAAVAARVHLHRLQRGAVRRPAAPGGGAAALGGAPRGGPRSERIRGADRACGRGPGVLRHPRRPHRPAVPGTLSRGGGLLPGGAARAGPLDGAREPAEPRHAAGGHRRGSLLECSTRARSCGPRSVR